MRSGAAGTAGRVGVGTEVALAGDIAQPVVGKCLTDDAGTARVDRTAGQPVETVIDEGLGQALIGVAAGGDVAQVVVLVGQVLDTVASTGLDGGDPAVCRVVALYRLDGIAVGLL